MVGRAVRRGWQPLCLVWVHMYAWHIAQCDTSMSLCKLQDGHDCNRCLKHAACVPITPSWDQSKGLQYTSCKAPNSLHMGMGSMISTCLVMPLLA